MHRLILFLLSLGFALSSQAKVLDIKQWQTKNKTNVYFVEAQSVPMVDIKIAFKAGSAFDGKKWGTAALTNQLLNQGAGEYNAQQIAEQFEEVGAEFSANVSKDAASISLRTLSNDKQLTQALNTFALVLHKPTFNETDVKREKKIQIAAIMQQRQSPANIANNTFYQKLYPHHPYGHATLGTPETVNSLNASDLKHFYRTHYLSSNAVLAIVGAMDINKAKKIAEKITQNLPQAKKRWTIPKARPLPTAEKEQIQYPSKQTVIRIGQLGITHKNPAYFPLVVGNQALGGGSLVSRLAEEIRQKRGLSYGIYSYFAPMPGIGPFIVHLATQNAKATTALTVTLTTLKQFIDNGPTVDELNAAKQYLVGSFPLRLSANKQIRDIILAMGMYHLPDDYLDSYQKNIQKVTLKQIKSAFKTQLHPDKLLTVTVGNG